MKPGKLTGQTAWISGGASGMGKATAELFAAEGAMVTVADIAGNQGAEVAESIRLAGGRAYFALCDVSSEKHVKDAIDTTVAEFGGLQIIVNCAGIAHVKLLHEYTEKEWDELMAVNVKSIFFSIKHGFTHLRKNRRSYVVNIGSVSSFLGQSQTPAYTTSKGAVLQLSKSIALDYAVDGIRCNCVCPGITDTPMLRRHMRTEEALNQRLHRVPMGVAMTPKDIAKAVLFLSCEDSSGITGTSLVVDGGYTAPAEWNTVQPTAFMMENTAIRRSTEEA